MIAVMVDRVGSFLGWTILGAQVLLYLWLESRPGRHAMAAFLLGPKLLGVAAVGACCLIALDAWRRRPRSMRDCVPIAAAFLAAIATVAISLTAYREYPSSYDSRPSRRCFLLPLEGEIAVQQGGKALADNYHAAFPPQRYAYDLSLIRDGRTYVREGYMAWDYYVYGKRVLSPSDGTVIRVFDGDPDQSPSSTEMAQFQNAGGNHVVLQVDPRQYLFIGHFQPNSIRVKPGDRVVAGAVLALAGNSGRSSAPHVHLHLQDSPDTNGGEGIPMEFCEYVAKDDQGKEESRVERGTPTGGKHRQIVRSTASLTGK